MMNLNKVGFLNETKCEYAKKVLNIEENTEIAVATNEKTNVKVSKNCIFRFVDRNNIIDIPNIRSSVAKFPINPFTPWKNGMTK